MTKHEQVLHYISELAIGEKISVRGIAKALQVSEGTAYHAIKEAETRGIVSTIERVGTIRIERKQRENVEQISFAEVVKIVEGKVIGGRDGLHKMLNQFVIGAMEIETMMTFIHPGDLLIVGNRMNAHERALSAGAAVLVTGGFSVDEKARKLADKQGLPIISSRHDTYTVAKLLNRAVYDQMIKQEILLAQDIAESVTPDNHLKNSDTVAHWHQRNIATKQSRFPVVDEDGKVVGIVSARDILGIPFNEPIPTVMSKNPITVMDTLSVVAAAHLMSRDGLETVPVTDDKNRLTGILRKKTVMNALQLSSRQNQETDTVDAALTATLVSDRTGNLYQIQVTPQMINYQGSVSYGALVSMLTEVANQSFQTKNVADFIVDNLNIHFLKNIPMDAILEFRPTIFEMTKNTGKMDIEVKCAGELVSKVLLSCQLLV